VSVKTSTTGPVPGLKYMGRATKAFAVQPHEALERTLEKIAEWRDERAIGSRYVVSEAPDEWIHQALGAQWPCDEREDFDRIWDEALQELSAQELRVGRGAFGGWDDGDQRLVRFAWCLARHLRPERVLETGVARGLTTRALLEALQRNGSGHVWSIDLPPLLEHGLSDETGAAVPARLRDGWTLVRGSSRRVLPELVTQLGSVDLFVHDSMHTTRNVAFELECVWPALRPGGVILIDDVEKNAAMGQFLRSHPEAGSMICASDDGVVLIGCLIKP
jgi:predicted O-methyltransferase YrrM